MDQEPHSGLPSTPASGRRGRLALVAAIFLAAAATRAWRITEPPLDFHASRQYRAALLARGFYLAWDPGAQEWRKEVASAQRRHLGSLEPPLLELAAAGAYRLLGAERLWLPRALSAVFWLVGGAFLYGIARRVGAPRPGVSSRGPLASADGAVLSLAYYLLLPFGIQASRSFQPDPLMVMLLLLSVLLLLRYEEAPTTKRLLCAAAAAGAGILVKPVCALPILLTFAALRTSGTRGLRWALRPHGLGFLAVSLSPSAAFYLRGMLAGEALGGQARGSFLPHLLLHGSFWLGWLEMAVDVVGPAPLLAAMLGMSVLPPGRPRALMLGLWSGYLVFGAVFTYHIHTHDYYHMMLIPIVAVSLGPIGDLVGRGVRELSSRQTGPAGRWYAGAILAATLVAAVTLSRIMTQYGSQRRYRQEVAHAPQIGRAVAHTTRAILLAYQYGNALMYHGELAGRWWPETPDIHSSGLRGEAPQSAGARLDRMLGQEPADYFIVTDLAELECQADLRQLLAERYRLLAKADGYVIFDLRKGPTATTDSLPGGGAPKAP